MPSCAFRPPHHEVEEPVKPAAYVQISRERDDLALDRPAVHGQDMRQYHRVGGAVMGAVSRADWMRQRVDRAETLLECGRAHGCGRHHLAARFDVGAIGKGAWQEGFDPAFPRWMPVSSPAEA